MLKQSITYTDYFGNDVSETLYFNLSKTELMDHLDLYTGFESIRDHFSGGARTLTPEEVQQVLTLVKLLMRLSYGVRSEDGRRFIKSNDLWEEFTQTAAYDTYLYSLFSDPDRAVQFMLGVFPQDLISEAMEQTGMTAPGNAPEVVASPTPEVVTSKELSASDVAAMDPADILKLLNDKR